MTPAARWAAAAEILDRIQTGEAAEKTLTTWARQHRFAGSKDRAAIRDHVFDVLRRRASSESFGGGTSGRALVLGYLRAIEADPAEVFTGDGHAMNVLTQEERAAGTPPTGDAALDSPKWLAPDLQASLGADYTPVMARLQARAALFLRVNLKRATVTDVQASLASAGIETAPHPLAATALEVTANPRSVAQSAAYRDGVIEIQDAASQAAADAVPLKPGDRVLDLCAGGGGKVLALGARHDGPLFAHDAHPDRMRDLPKRAARAGQTVTRLASASLAAHAPFDVVVADVPCSGSGAWRRQPEAKWRLDRFRLDGLTGLQSQILDQAASLTGRVLAYMTCSLLAVENEDVVQQFLRRQPKFELLSQRRISPLEGADGFFVAIIHRRG